MKKRSLFILLLLVLCMLPMAVSADVGPKPSITVNAINMPGGECYMDLLVEVDTPNETDPDFLKSEYNQDMIQFLSSYHKDGWSAAITNRERIIFNDIKCEVSGGKSVKNFGYMPPDRFKIIVISSTGEFKVSNIIERKAFNSTIDFDYSSGEAKENSVMSSTLLQFLISCLLTLLIESLILIAFKFSFKKYWILVLLVNILTQILLAFAISLTMYAAGLFGAIFAYMLAEFAIFILETAIYGVTLKQHKVGRRILYALTANIVSFIAGFFIILVFS